jgi:hypothetical protein
VFIEEESAATGSISMEVDNEPEHLYRDVGVRGIPEEWTRDRVEIYKLSIMG